MNRICTIPIQNHHIILYTPRLPESKMNTYVLHQLYTILVYKKKGRVLAIYRQYIGNLFYKKLKNNAKNLPHYQLFT